MTDRSLLLGAVVLLAIGGCSDVSAPASRTGDVVYVMSENNVIFVVDPRMSRVIAQAGPVPEIIESPVLSSDSSTLFFSGFGPGPGAIYALDAHTYTAQPWYELNSLPAPPLDSVWIGGRALAVAPGRGELYAGNAIVADSGTPVPLYIPGVAIIDTASRTVKGSVSPIFITGLTALPAGPVAPHGALLGSIPPTSRADELCWLVVIDPATRSVVDSVSVPNPAPGRGEAELSLAVSPDGERVFMIGFLGVYGYDLVTHRLFGSVSTDSYDTHVAVSPDGAKVYITSVAFPVYGAAPAPNTVRVFDRNLVEQAPISFTRQFGDRTPVLHDVIVSRDNASLYLEAGDRDFFGEGMLRVLVLNLSTGSVTKTISTGVYGQARLILGRAGSP